MNIEQQIKNLLGDDNIILETPKLPEHGEFSTNIAMKLAKEQKKNPMLIAREIADGIDITGTYISKIEVVGGYINFFVNDDWYKSIPLEAVTQGENWGKGNSMEGEKICLEYVSANPTGPMHMGNARGGVLGDSLARAMSFCGAAVTKEFYLNDAGNQIEKLRLSLEARFKQLKGEDVPFSEEWYQGSDITEHAQRWLDNGHDTAEGLVSYALEKNIEDMKRILTSYNLEYDVWFRESELYENGSVKRAIDKLAENGKTYEKCCYNTKRVKICNHGSTYCAR